MKRRNFIIDSSQYAAVLGLGMLPLTSSLVSKRMTKLTILHTNDVHSRIDPFPADHRRYPAQGGAVARKSMIDQIRQQEKNVILLDAGDMMQGTPYFNFFNGKLEIELMDKLGYDAGTIGNHDFDAGVEALSDNMKNASFPLLNCNYNLQNSPLEQCVLPYKIIEKDRLKIGILGVGVELDGLVPPHLYGDIGYLDPVKHVNATARKLKEEHQCQLIIVLSHLGLDYKTNKISDVKLARMSENVDIILGGHTHNFLEEPMSIKNKSGQFVLINQVGWAGLILGRIDVVFSSEKKPFKIARISNDGVKI